MAEVFKVKDKVLHEDQCKGFRENYLNAADNENYGFAIYEEKGKYYAGYSDAFNYCPFCGGSLNNE